ncbi:MAG: magnesium/cobalt transporter CorA [Candidatus Micrarchaeota archaeon]
MDKSGCSQGVFIIRSFVYEDGKLKEERDIAEMARQLLNAKSIIWVDLSEPTQEEIKLLETTFNFHPLTIEDILHENQRPKIETYDDYAFIAIRTLSPETPDLTYQLNFYLGKTFIVSVNQHPIKAVKTIIEKCSQNPLYLKRGPDFLLYSILDAVVDDVFPKLIELDDNIEEIESKIFESPSQEQLNMLFGLKRKALLVRKVMWPMRDIFNVLARLDTDFIRKSNHPYFRDVYDHTIRITEMLDMDRELITNSMEAYLSIVSNNLNIIMKKLASIAAIVMVPTLIAGVYGMNFKVMPEVEWAYGYYFALALMGGSVLLLFIYFKRRGWL